MSRARDDEWTFVLLGRDLAATHTVDFWIRERIRLGKNAEDDPQIIEARNWIKSVQTEHPPKLDDPHEDQWARCLRLAREIPKDELIKKLLLQMYAMRKRHEQTTPLWSFVGMATSHGSGVSSAICAIYGLNPETGRLR